MQQHCMGDFPNYLEFSIIAYVKHIVCVLVIHRTYTLQKKIICIMESNQNVSIHVNVAFQLYMLYVCCWSNNRL